MILMCECDSFRCPKTIDVPLDEAKKAKMGDTRIIIVDGCPVGPESTDVLVSKETGYTIYKTV